MLAAACGDDDEATSTPTTPCSKQPYRHLESPEFDAGDDGASYVALATFCQNGCPAAESDLIERTTCRVVSLDASATDGDAQDAGVRVNPVEHRARTEGCGFVQVRSPNPSLGGGYFTFALDGGALVGAGRYDDIPFRITGSSCDDYSFVAGVITPSCPDASVLYCDRKR